MKEKEFREKIKNDIKEIDSHYKACKGNVPYGGGSIKADE